MKKVYVWLIVAALLSSCGPGSSAPPTNSSSIVGKYNGNLTIDGTDPLVALNTTFTVDAAGNLNGTTAIQGSSTPNGTVKGTVTGSNDLSLSFNLTFESATLGKYTMSGTGVYASLSKSLGAPMLPSKNASGTYIGDAVFGGTKE